MQGGISIVVGGAARGREAGGTRFDSPLARFPENPKKLDVWGPEAQNVVRVFGANKLKQFCF